MGKHSSLELHKLLMSPRPPLKQSSAELVMREGLSFEQLDQLDGLSVVDDEVKQRAVIRHLTSDLSNSKKE